MDVRGQLGGLAYSDRPRHCRLPVPRHQHWACERGEAEEEQASWEQNRQKENAACAFQRRRKQRKETSEEAVSCLCGPLYSYW